MCNSSISPEIQSSVCFRIFSNINTLFWPFFPLTFFPQPFLYLGTIFPIIWSFHHPPKSMAIFSSAKSTLEISSAIRNIFTIFMNIITLQKQQCYNFHIKWSKFGQNRFSSFLPFLIFFWEQCIRSDSSQVSSLGSKITLNPLKHAWSPCDMSKGLSVEDTQALPQTYALLE